MRMLFSLLCGVGAVTVLRNALITLHVGHMDTIATIAVGILFTALAHDRMRR